MRMSILATAFSLGILAGPAVAAPLAPLPAEACARLGDVIETRLNLDAGFHYSVMVSAPDHRRAFGLESQRCLLWARLPGFTKALDAFRSRPDLGGELRTTFLALGWQEQDAYAADGPEGTGFGFSRDRDLCLSQVTREDYRPAGSDGPPQAWEQGYRVEISCYREQDG